MGKTLLRGIFAIAPLAITIILVYWLYTHLEVIFGAPILYFYPEIYFPGLGILIALVVLFILGLLLNHWLIERMYVWFENQLKKIPLLKTIYTSVTDLMSFFQTDKKNKNNQVVMVELAGVKMMGLVTRESFDDLPEGIGKEDEITVFFPFSYQIGGLLAVVPKKMVQPVDLSVEKGLRFMATAGNPSDEKSATNGSVKNGKVST